MTSHATALLGLLEPGERVRHLALARLDNPTAIQVLRHSPLTASRLLNELKGALLAVTDRRLIYLGQTFVGRGTLKRGNEVIVVPLTTVEDVRSKRGRGSGGDIRKVLTLIASGSKLWLRVDGVEHEFIEIKPLDAAGEMEAAIRSTALS